MSKEYNYYVIPNECWFRIHFVRPRFKNNIENVLLYMANECCRIPRCSCEEYSQRYFNAIKMFPGNINRDDKTLNNWRTETPALFGFYTENKKENVTETSKMAHFLHKNQDLTQFLRIFLFSFQIPGGHMKPHELKEVINKGIRFKPANMIIKVLLAGNEILSKQNFDKNMSITAEEVTYCIFNDTRVTSGKISPARIAEQILSNRGHKLKYYNTQDTRILSSKGKPRSKGDITRYAKDILDYMLIANLLDSHNGYFTLKGNEKQVIETFANDKTYFDGYEPFYNKEHIEVSELAKVEPLWFDYVNRAMNPNLFKTNIKNFINQNGEDFDVVFDTRIKDVVTSNDTTTKDIGNLGEALICSHERMRLKLNGYEDFVRLVQIVDSPSYHPGFDIDSYEADGTEDHRYIEVKTTISKKRIQLYGFHMSTNEWRVAGTIKEHYCVYRLMLNESEKTLFILRDPVRLYKKDMIEAEPRDGMEITFSQETFKPTKLLAWKK